MSSQGQKHRCSKSCKEDNHQCDFCFKADFKSSNAVHGHWRHCHKHPSNIQKKIKQTKRTKIKTIRTTTTFEEILEESEEIQEKKDDTQAFEMIKKLTNLNDQCRSQSNKILQQSQKINELEEKCKYYQQQLMKVK